MTRKMTIEQLGLKTRTCEAFAAAGVKYVEMLLAMDTFADLEKLSGVGKGARTELYPKMREHGFCNWANKMDKADNG